MGLLQSGSSDCCFHLDSSVGGEISSGMQRACGCKQQKDTDAQGQRRR